MKLQKLINEYKNRTGFNNEMIARKVGVSKSTVGRWVKGEVTTLQSETIDRLSQVLEIDVDEWLSQADFIFKKPILGVVKAGYDLLAEENIEGYMEVSSYDNQRGDYFLRVVGNSMMQANIFEDDLLYIAQCQDVPSGTIGIVLVGEEVTVKRIMKKADMLILEAANPLVENRYFTRQEIEQYPVQILGKVLYSHREY